MNNLSKKKRISATLLSDFFTCEALAWYRYHFGRDNLDPVTSYSAKIMEAGVQYENALIKKYSPFEIDPSLDFQKRFEQTLDIIQRRKNAIHHAILTAEFNNQTFLCEPDLLLLNQENNYKIIEIKHSAKVKSTHIIQLIFNAKLYHYIFGVIPECVITLGDGNEYVINYQSYLPIVDNLIERLILSLGSSHPTFESKPICLGCVRRSICFKNDPTKLGTIFSLKKKEREILTHAGISTRKELAGIPTDIDFLISGFHRERMARLIIQAKSLEENKVIALKKIDKSLPIIHLIEDQIHSKRVEVLASIGDDGRLIDVLVHPAEADAIQFFKKFNGIKFLISGEKEKNLIFEKYLIPTMIFSPEFASKVMSLEKMLWEACALPTPFYYHNEILNMQGYLSTSERYQCELEVNNDDKALVKSVEHYMLSLRKVYELILETKTYG